MLLLTQLIVVGFLWWGACWLADHLFQFEERSFSMLWGVLVMFFYLLVNDLILVRLIS